MNLTLSQQALVFTCLQYKSFENTVRKGEIARNEQFLLFPQCFLSVWRTSCHFHQTQTRGVRGREVERRPCNPEVPSSSPGSGSQLWDFSLAHTFGASTGIVPRKQNRERLA